MEAAELFRREKISKILCRLAPPVMLAQLIQALYNIIDSLFVGRYSDAGLTALSIIYPMQLLMIALAVGTLCFVSVPAQMLHVFTSDARVIEIGRIGFRFVGVSFIPMVTIRDQKLLVGAAAWSGRTGHIDFLGVHPQYRRHGIAKAFLDFILQNLSSGETISITTFREGDKADTGQRAACRRLGFAEAELLTEFGYPCRLQKE